MVGVLAVGRRGNVVAVNDKVNVVAVDPVELRRVRRVLDDLVDPLAGADGRVATERRSGWVKKKNGTSAPFGVVHDSGALVLLDLDVRMDADDQDVAHRLGLAHRVCVPKVHHVKAAVDPDAEQIKKRGEQWRAAREKRTERASFGAWRASPAPRTRACRPSQSFDRCRLGCVGGCTAVANRGVLTLLFDGRGIQV